MDVGSDYLLYQKREEPRSHRALGIVLLGLGALLVIVSAGYYAYATYARSQLDELVTTSSLDLPGEAAPVAPDSTTAGQPSSAAPVYVLPSQAAVSLYPALALQPQGWTNALWAEDPGIATGSELLARYQPVDWSALPPSDALPPPLAMRIPAIGLDASVESLQILDLGDYREYDTPKFTVGFIPDTANPGSAGNGWYFGHLQSPIKGEGSVFRDLPELAEVVRSGEKVYITVESGAGSYLYQVTRTWVVSGNDFELTPSSEPTITLVTCVPPLVYDHRLLVEAKLAGFLPAEGG